MKKNQKKTNTLKLLKQWIFRHRAAQGRRRNDADNINKLKIDTYVRFTASAAADVTNHHLFFVRSQECTPKLGV